MNPDVERGNIGGDEPTYDKMRETLTTEYGIKFIDSNKPPLPKIEVVGLEPSLREKLDRDLQALSDYYNLPIFTDEITEHDDRRKRDRRIWQEKGQKFYDVTQENKLRVNKIRVIGLVSDTWNHILVPKLEGRIKEKIQIASKKLSDFIYPNGGMSAYGGLTAIQDKIDFVNGLDKIILEVFEDLQKDS